MAFPVITSVAHLTSVSIDERGPARRSGECRAYLKAEKPGTSVLCACAARQYIQRSRTNDIVLVLRQSAMNHSGESA